MHRVRNEKTFFLFDKVLLITKKRGGHFVYKGHIPVTRPHLLLPRFPPSQRAGSIFLLCARLGWASGWGGRSSTLEEYSLPPLTALRSGVPGGLPAAGLTAVSPCPSQCSSLMLIESARESLSFTVTHYKHGKQQYNIQVRGGPGHDPGGPAGCRLGRGLPLPQRREPRSLPRKAEVLGGVSWACAEELREAHSTPSPLSASAHLGRSLTHAGCLWACRGNPLLLSWALPGQNGGGETEVDSPHQEAHSGQPPYHHPPEGELLGRLMVAGSGCPSEPAPGNPGPHPLDAVLCTSPVGGPGATGPRKKWLIAR